MVMGLFPTVSFLSVVAVSIDRFMAIHLHLRYQELVTHKRVVAVVISIWLFSASFSLAASLAPSFVKLLVLCLGVAVDLLLTTVVYARL